MATSLSLRFEKKKYGTIIFVAGDLTQTTRPQLSAFLRKLMSEDHRRVALDLQNLNYIDSKGILAIKFLLAALNHKAIPLYAYGMNEEIATILDVVEFDGNIHLLEDKPDFSKLG